MQTIRERIIAAVSESSDKGMVPRDVLGVIPDAAGEQVRRALQALVHQKRLYSAPEPGAKCFRYFGADAQAQRWRKAHPTGLTDAEAKGVHLKLGKRAGAVKAKAALAPAVTLRHDMRRKVGDGAAIYTGQERVTVAQHKPDPRYYVDPATMPRTFSAMPIGSYLESGA